MKQVLFFRNYRKFTGGHLKVWDYFNHVLLSPSHTPVIYFSRMSKWGADNPWRKDRSYVLESVKSIQPDIIFLAGMDWRMLTEFQKNYSSVPIINFIQHVRHSWPDDPRYAFLQHKAIRICCSTPVGQALEATGRVNGPLFVIPNGLSPESFPEPIQFHQKDLDILIVANKRPRLGQMINFILWRPWRRNLLLSRPVTRKLFLALLNRSKITVFLPHRAEGFYLPSLEGMAMDTIVVCPDCIGNSSHCLHNWNCFRPDYKLADIFSAVAKASRLQQPDIERMLANARSTFIEHNLENERRAFLNILDNIDHIWRS